MNVASNFILHEDEHILVLAKPSKIHSAMLPNGNNGDSIAKQLIDQYPYLADASQKPEDAGLVHRLDYETSGCLLVAKDRESWTALREDLLAGKISKTYLALADGEIKDNLTIDTYLGSEYRRSKKVKVYEKPPRAAKRYQKGVTKFSPTEFFPDHNATLVEASAPVARRHQIRAHAAYAGHPLIGDDLYGSQRKLAEVLGESCDRSFVLHAHQIAFSHPKSKEQIKIVSVTTYPTF